MSTSKKHKGSLTNKLIMCFACSILIVAIIIGSVFALLFQKHVEITNKEKMEQTAVSISTIFPSASFVTIFLKTLKFSAKMPINMANN